MINAGCSARVLEYSPGYTIAPLVEWLTRNLYQRRLSRLGPCTWQQAQVSIASYGKTSRVSQLMSLTPINGNGIRDGNQYLEGPLQILIAVSDAIAVDGCEGHELGHSAGLAV